MLLTTFVSVPTCCRAAQKTIFQNAQFDHTISPRLKNDDSHIRVTRGLMTRNIGSRYSDLFDEISMTLESLLAGADKGRHKYGSLLLR